MSTYEAKSKLLKGVATSVVERDERGDIIGAYTGYWNPDKRKVVLYPDYRHPAVKAGVRLIKKEVYDGHVRVRSAGNNTSSGATRSRHLPLEGKANKGAGTPNSTRLLRSLPIMGQEKMKF